MSFEDPTADELRILAVLVGVCGQYMPGSRLYISHDFMSAGEHAVHLLSKYGLVRDERAVGLWTTKACLLEGLDDIDLTNIDDIMAMFKELPADELLTVQPGERQHKCDVQLDLLRIWLPGRAMSKYINRPETIRRPAYDRLDVEARLDLGDATATIRGEILTVAELQEFRDQLTKVLAGSRKRAYLLAYKNCLEIKVLAKSGGSFTGEITITNPIHKHSTRADFSFKDDFHLKHTVSQLDELLARFPPV